jgi:hypothetical protein
MPAVATKSSRKGSSRFQSYEDLIPHTEKPLAKRRELAIGRGGAHVVPRKFHLTAEEIDGLKAEYAEVKPKRIPNPHNKGMYWAIWEALILLGRDQEHPYSRVMKKVETLLSDEDTKDDDGQTAWDRFANKDPRNNDTGKDADARFYQNVIVQQRLTGRTPYGYKMRQVCQEVCGFDGGVLDVLKHDTGTLYLKLNTRSVTPVNENKVRGMGSPADVAARKAEARAAKAKSNKRKAKKSAPAKEAQKSDDTAPAASSDNGTADSAATATA